MINSWRKAGVLLAPQKDIWWMSQHVGPSFLDLRANSEFDLFVTGRDHENISRIGVIKGEVVGCRLVLDTPSLDPVFDIGAPGCFDENGVSYPWLVHDGKQTLLFYVGWVAGGRTGFQNYTGLAISSSGNYAFQRVSPVPILDRNNDEPYGSGSCAVTREGPRYVMLYTSFHRWREVQYKGRQVSPCYDVKIAYSEDGQNWCRRGEVAIALTEDETVAGRPSIFRKSDGSYAVYFSARGQNYKIYKAEGSTLDSLIRIPTVELDTSVDGWDSQMVEYSHVVETEDHRFMIYNGNEFGKTGLGYAWQEI